MPFYPLTRLAGALLLLLGSLHAQSTGNELSHVHAARPPASRIYFGQDIFVAPGQQIHNASCLFCSVQVEGDISGNVFVLFGNVTVTGQVAGNAVVIGGNEVVDAQARIGGRTTVVGGNAVYESDEALSGNAYVLGGHISNFAGHGSSHRRLSLSPIFFTAVAVLAVLLFAAALSPRSRKHRAHS